MDEIVVLSGKGGTGKTSVTAAFAHLAGDAVLCDLDVDAPDLHLLLRPEMRRTHAFISGHEARIDPERCTGCGLCRDHCRFDAIREGTPAAVDPIRCEGCKLCVALCPEGAVAFPEKHCGDWHVSDTRFGKLVHAQLFPGEENSGRLVALLRREARRLAEETGSDMILCDGPPGIGCPVISSLSGANFAAVVTEPTLSGRHDLERVLALCDHFRVPAGVILNKCDLHAAQSEAISAFCAGRGIPVIARIPHDTDVTRAMVAGLTITEYDAAAYRDRFDRAWNDLVAMASGRAAA